MNQMIKKICTIIRYKKLLLSFKGIGRKVCDCILLLGYSKFDIVPIDVHMFRVSKKIFNLNYKTLTNNNYDQIVKLYKQRFGKYCGIAQLYLLKLT